MSSGTPARRGVEMPEYVNVEPTDEGYGNILMMFVQNVMGDVHVRRKRDVAKIMAMIIQLSAYLGQKKPDELKRVKDYLERISQ